MSQLKQQTSVKQKLLFEHNLLTRQKKKENIIPITIPIELWILFDNIISQPPDFFCKFCGSTNPEDHIKKEKRKRIHKSKRQQWKCKKYNKKFIYDPSPFNYPLWVCYTACSYLSSGMSLSAIKNNLELEAYEKNEIFSIKISSLRRLLDAILQLLHEFENDIKNPIESDLWEIDEISQRFSLQGSNQESKRKKRIWIITVSAVRFRYLLAMYICTRRSYNNSLKALEIARCRAKCDPKFIRCDGLKSNEKAAKKLFPNAVVDSKSKKVSFGHINPHERIHKTVRLGALPKKRRFYSFGTLEIYMEIDRIDYNHVRTNDSPDETPSQKAHVDFGVKNWRDLLYLALKFHMKRQFIEEQRKIQLNKNKKSS